MLQFQKGRINKINSIKFNMQNEIDRAYIFESERRFARAERAWAIFETTTEIISWLALFGFAAYVIWQVVQ